MRLPGPDNGVLREALFSPLRANSECLSGVGRLSCGRHVPENLALCHHPAGGALADHGIGSRARAASEDAVRRAVYSAVNTTLYRHFAIVGGGYEITSILAAVVLAYLVRRQGPSFGWTLIGALFLMVAFGIWLAVVAPVNREVAVAMSSAWESVPAVWMRLRARWEYGHAAGFIAQLLGVSALMLSILVEAPVRPLRSSQSGWRPDRLRRPSILWDAREQDH